MIANGWEIDEEDEDAEGAASMTAVNGVLALVGVFVAAVAL